MAELITHLSMARGYRGGEHQARLLIDELHTLGITQRLVARRGEPLAERVSQDSLCDVHTVAGSLLAAARGCRGSTLVHAHDGRSVHAAALAHTLYRTPYLITRRVDNPLKQSFLTRRSYANAARVVALSGAIEAQVRKLSPNIRCQVIPDASSNLPVDESVVARLRQEHAGRHVVGHAGALDHSHKGQRDIIEAARRLEASHPDVLFVLLGSGVDEEDLRARAASLSNVIMPGHVSNMGDYLTLFDAFVFPSLHEGMGSVLLDAMAFGLPIVATAVGGIVDLIEHDRNGLLIEPGAPDQLGAAVIRLREDASLAQRLALGARTSAQDYTAAKMARRYGALYATLGVSPATPDTL